MKQDTFILNCFYFAVMARKQAGCTSQRVHVPAASAHCEETSLSKICFTVDLGQTHGLRNCRRLVLNLLLFHFVFKFTDLIIILKV